MIKPTPETIKKQVALDRRALWKCIEARLESGLPEWRKRIDALDQVAAVEARSAGRIWSDDEVFEALVMAVLSAEVHWSTIDRIRADLAEPFSGFNLELYAELSYTEVHDRLLPWFKSQRAGSRGRRRGLVGLIGAARKLLQHSRTHGTADAYFTSLMQRCGEDPKLAALCLGCPGKDKLPSLGVPLAAEALKNLGFNVAKPDRHVVRAVGSFGMAEFGRWSDETDLRTGTTAPNPTPKRQLAAMTAVQEIAGAADEPVVLVDNAIWLLCAERKSGLYLPNSELAELARRGEAQDNQPEGLGALIQSWMNEDDGGEHQETIEHLTRALDEDRLSDRKHFPEELKGKSW